MLMDVILTYQVANRAANLRGPSAPSQAQRSELVALGRNFIRFLKAPQNREKVLSFSVGQWFTCPKRDSFFSAFF